MVLVTGLQQCYERYYLARLYWKKAKGTKVKGRKYEKVGSSNVGFIQCLEFGKMR